MTHNEMTRPEIQRDTGPPEGPVVPSAQLAGAESRAEAETIKATPPCQEPSIGGLADLLAERDDLVRRLQRVSADYVNYQKRILRDIEQVREFANEDLIKALLPVLDDIDRALGAAEATLPPRDPLLLGIQLVRDKAVAALRQFGLEAIDSLSKPFDPDRHCAVEVDTSGESPPNTVVRETRKGYVLKSRTIRPAMVVVSAAVNANKPTATD